MNQILVTGYEEETISRNNNNVPAPRPQKQKVGIKPIVIVFCILIIIFAICAIVLGIFINKNVKAKKIAEANPEVEMVQDDDTNTVNFKFSHVRGLDSITYSWNNEQIKTTKVNNQKYKEDKIDLIGGKNTLHVTITDESGKISKYDYNIESDLAIINLDAVENGVKINVKSDNGIKEVKYKWDNNNGQEKTLRPEENKKNELEAIISIPEGNHTLMIEVNDENGKTTKKQRDVIGDTAPKIKLKGKRTDDGKKIVIIEAEADTNISKIEIKINDEVVVNEENVNKTKYTDIEREVNTGDEIRIKVYNKNNLMAEMERSIKE